MPFLKRVINLKTKAMKKLILLSAMALTLSLQAQENKTWRWGVQWGVQSNGSKYSGGMPDANARFNVNPNGGGALGLVARYDHNQHWMATFGLGFSTYGFNFAMANNYSFLNNMQNRFYGVQTSFTAIEAPIMIHYKFNMNCKNTRWVVGAGFVPTLSSKQTISKFDVKNNDGITSSQSLNSTSTSNGGGNMMLRFAIGREKVFKRGGIFNASFILNAGLNQYAKATVNYTIDNQVYQHQFTNNGNFVGFRLSYFFRPCVKSQMKNIQSHVTNTAASTN